MNKHKTVAALLLAALLAPAARAASPVPPIITNIVSTQRPGTMMVDTTYDLIDPDSAQVFLIMEYSTNNGVGYLSPRSDAISGDVWSVTPGTGKRIVWNAWSDAAGIYVTNSRIRLTADDTGNSVVPPTNTPPGQNLAWVPPGSFDMSGTFVWLTPGFWMGKYEVTQGEYVAVMTNNPSSHIGDTNRPVEQLTWSEATLYCERITARERTAGRINTSQSYRLPTEAEWEWACRAGTTNNYFFGDSSSPLSSYAWWGQNNIGHPRPVGTRVPNRWGLYDMLGNVYEWCSDWSGTLPGGNVTNPQGPSNGNGLRSIRGGAFNGSDLFAFNSSNRGGKYPENPYSYIGFRVVLSPPQ